MRGQVVILAGGMLLALAGLSLAHCRPAERPQLAELKAPVALWRGINLGNALEGPYEGAWGLVLEEAYFEAIAEAGFDHVRIPIRWSAHAAQQAPYTLDERFARRVDWAVEQSLSRGLVTVINVHHYEALMEDPPAHRERFLALWRQIAERYRDQPPELYFELLNEPTGRLTPRLWNAYLAEAIDVVRESNPERTIVVGTAEWGGLRALPQLELPDDPHLLVTFHYYEPFAFTHQGAEWVSGTDRWLGTTWTETARQKAEVRRHLDAAVAWAEKRDRPLWLGEFGAYGKADMASRARWTAFVAREAEARGIGWCYWEFGAGFGAYDRAARRWRPELYTALMPDRALPD